MTNALYDGQPLTVDEYLATPETTKRYELVYGVVREPAAPAWDHQMIVARLFGHLDRHVTNLEIGKVGLSPLDVVLDSHNHLVVQPDIVFVSTARTHIIRDRLWGAPDLVVEVLSPALAATIGTSSGNGTSDMASSNSGWSIRLHVPSRSPTWRCSRPHQSSSTRMPSCDRRFYRGCDCASDHCSRPELVRSFSCCARAE